MSPAWGNCTKIGAIVANQGDAKGFGAVTDLHFTSPQSLCISPLIYCTSLTKKWKDIPWPEVNVPNKKQMTQ